MAVDLKTISYSFLIRFHRENPMKEDIIQRKKRPIRANQIKNYGN